VSEKKLDTSNEIFELAVDLVQQSNRNIFLTGKAGTGKTTFLKHIRENCAKQMVVLAPTGVAAINAGGATIHSFFLLPFSPFIPSAKGTGFSSSGDKTLNRHSLISHLRYNSDKRKQLMQLELLIIDEISMVRCDLLDAIDTILRYFRKRPTEQFGGVQLLFIGDMFQLPPVVKDQEWQMLSDFYDSPYFFSSQVLKEHSPLYIEFEKIYRQSDETFIRILNQVRNNELDEDGMKVLESRFNPTFRRSKDDGYIILTTHNEQARNINIAALNNLKGKSMQYEAEISGSFQDKAYPADEILYLKIGAQVMFIKNDTADRGKRYFNGKIGIVKELDDENIIVVCNDDATEIEVKKEEWENIRYSIDKTSQSLQSETLGTFKQYPLRLAWAITIHKSQGLTFEKAIIDAGEAFASGQVYVALSRCVGLEGLILKSRIRTASLSIDKRIIEYSKNISTSQSLQEEFYQARKNYQLQVLIQTFNFNKAINYCTELGTYLIENISSFNPESNIWLEQLSKQLNTHQETATKFHVWLKAQFELPEAPEKNTALIERIGKAANHFLIETKNLLHLLQQSPAITDSKLHAKEYNETLKEIFTELCVTRHILQNFGGSVNPIAWQQQKKNFVLPSFTVNAYSGTVTKTINSPHAELYLQLKNLRDEICAEKNVPVYLVLGSKTLEEMSGYLPHTLAELKSITGFGEVKIKQYGQQFLDIILKYCEEENLSSLIHEKKAKKEKKSKAKSKIVKENTFEKTFQLFKEGKTIGEIAKERNFATTTIEGHLSKYISTGEIEITTLISPERIALINDAIKATDVGSLNVIKQKLPSDISYGEIRMVLAANKTLPD